MVFLPPKKTLLILSLCLFLRSKAQGLPDGHRTAHPVKLPTEEALSPRFVFAPSWGFHAPELTVIRMLRDYPNGETGSRPHKEILVYGERPTWVWALRESGFKVVGMWKHKTPWKHFIVGNPIKTPFLFAQFQVYLFEDLDDEYEPIDQLAYEITRIVSPWGFFLCRPALCQRLTHKIVRFGWMKLRFMFHDMAIYQRDIREINDCTLRTSA